MIDTRQSLLPTAAPNSWDDSDRTTLVCRQVLDITHDVKSFHFVAEDGGHFRFDPGQFITLELTLDGAPISRCYTISSPPTRPHLLAITVKRVGGPVSSWLHDNVVAGTRIQALAPLGSFTIAERPAAKYLFMSAGSGITPMMSMTRTLCDLGSDADILFVHNARTPADIIFRRELESIASIAPNVRVVHICEADSPPEPWLGLRGRVSAPLLQAVAPDFAERVVYTCGPAPYMGAVRQVLEESGFDMANYNEESFSFEKLLAEELEEVTPSSLIGHADIAIPPGPDQTDTSYAVEFVRSGKTLRCGSGENILDAAASAGMRLPSSCGQGICGTCKSSMLDGEVDMQHNGGIRPKEIAQGKILICCSTPLSNIRIDA